MRSYPQSNEILILIVVFFGVLLITATPASWPTRGSSKPWFESIGPARAPRTPDSSLPARRWTPPSVYRTARWNPATQMRLSTL